MHLWGSFTSARHLFRSRFWGVTRKFVVEPAHVWWLDSMVQVSFFRALHEKDNSKKSQGKFFLIALICSFAWYVFLGYLFEILASISWVY
ncbi:hypothetical protein SLA2020_051400 [Shorea laevis]